MIASFHRQPKQVEFPEPFMKRIVAFTFFLLFLAAFAFISLDGLKRNASEANSDSEQVTLNFMQTDWALVDTGGVTVEHEMGVFVRFAEDGKLTGHAGCNGFFGSYKIDGSTIEIGQLGATRKMCPEPVMQIEYTFMNALQNARTFGISGDQLMLYDEQDRSMTLSGTANQQETK
jgi:heat shock protein HslJ